MIPYVNNMDEFKKLLAEAGDKLVVVDFTATWCGPCKMIAPKFEELSHKHENLNVVFLKVDVDEAMDVVRDYEIKAMPTFLYFKNGIEINRCCGSSIEKVAAVLELYRN